MIETPRLILRPITRDDLEALASMNADADVMRYIGYGKPQTLSQTRIRLNAILDHWDQHGFGLCAVVEKVTLGFIGFCGLQYLDNTSEIEVGYRLAKQFWGMGFATETGRASVRHGFDELALDRIVAVVQPENVASQRVLEKIGLTYVRGGRFYDTDVKYFAITREEWRRDDSTHL